MSKESHCADIPRVKSVHCFASFPDVTRLKMRNASALATVFRERAPFCDYKSSFPFSLPAEQAASITDLAIAGGTGNTVELKSLDLSSLSKLRSLYIEERCFQLVLNFTIHGLAHLQSVFIEDFCFIARDAPFEDTLSITDCASLETICIGSGSFCRYSFMKLESACAGSW